MGHAYQEALQYQCQNVRGGSVDHPDFYRV